MLGKDQTIQQWKTLHEKNQGPGGEACIELEEAYKNLEKKNTQAETKAEHDAVEMADLIKVKELLMERL
jgi:hypothetical protein